MIQIPAIHQDIHLAEYAPEFEEQTISVRVNPTRATLLQIAELRTAITTDSITPEVMRRFAVLIGKLWSWSPDDVLKLFNDSYETDPRFFEWLVVKTITMVTDHRQRLKKN